MRITRGIRKKIKDKATGIIKGKVKKSKKKLVAILIILISLILIAAILIINIVQYMTTLTRIAIIANSVLDDSMVGDVGTTPEFEFVDDSEYPIYGKYPVDHSLRIKQEMMEICDQVGALYGIPGKFILAVLSVESQEAFFNMPLEKANGSLYYDLCIVETTRSNKTPFFIDGENTGKYTDKHGNKIVDPLKVGTLASPVGEALGAFQFLDTYIAGRVTSIYEINDGRVSKVDGVPMMSQFDAELGFMRPNPFYFPDMALNCAKFMKGLMDNHQSYIDEISGYGIPDNILQEILFIYGADAYHGDTGASSKGTEAINVHNMMGKLYADVYLGHKDKAGLTSLGDFSKGGYHQASVRAVVAGSQFGGDNVDFDGTFNNFSRNEVKEDSIGKYVELSGKRYYQPFVAELSNTSRFNIDYKSHITNMRAYKGNKFGLVYGFQGLNMATYYMDFWSKEIEAAPKQIIGGQKKYYGDMPYKLDSNSVEEMLVAGSSVVGKVRYILGGGHYEASNLKTINPLWRRFSQLYVDVGMADRSIHWYSSATNWCPIHGKKSTQKDEEKNDYCTYDDVKYKSAEKMLKDRKTDLVRYGDIYAGINPNELDSIFRGNISNANYHVLEGLDCSGFVSWMFNQVIPNDVIDGRSWNFITNNKLITEKADGSTEIKNAKILPGDIITGSVTKNKDDGHIFAVVGPISDKNDVFLLIEATPPEVRFGVAYKSGRDNEDYKKAVELAKKANIEIGGTSGAFSARQIDRDGLYLGRYEGFTDKEFLNKYAEEILNIILDRLPDEYKGR